ncbi:MAG: 2-amino-4-hydroxy-6-hydroxymethyldihydropteridine diphosphokinase [Marinobacterium sp.]|nr:2-amino-4-hydroxy-6-hydroxymethyldihydropteridine diphosphokinase [Marinobacterium sp.]
MARIYVSIGSNQQREKHILSCLDALADQFGELTLSSVYESEAVGFDGDNFYNLVAGFDTELAPGELSRQLKAIEDANGRVRSGPRFSGRTLDIDILTWADLSGVHDGIELPREEVLTNAFVLLPLSEIAPDLLHPQAQRTCAELWQAYDRSKQPLWAIDFSWRGRMFSRA